MVAIRLNDTSLHDVVYQKTEFTSCYETTFRFNLKFGATDNQVICLVTVFFCCLMQTVIKSYYDGPIPVSLSSSLHNVASGREREGNGIGYVMGRVEHMNSVGQQQHHLLPNQKLTVGLAMRSGPQGTVGAYSESNLLALGSQQHRYSPQHHTQHKNAFLYGNMGE